MRCWLIPLLIVHGVCRCAVDYILFFTGDVDVTPNLNEIRDHKYVSKEELQAMFDDPSTLLLSVGCSLWFNVFVLQATASHRGSSSSRAISCSVGGTSCTSEKVQMARLSRKV